MRHEDNVQAIMAETLKKSPYDLSTFNMTGQYPRKEILIGIIHGWAMIGELIVYNHKHGYADGEPCWERIEPEQYEYYLSANDGWRVPFHVKHAEDVRRECLAHRPASVREPNGDPIEWLIIRGIQPVGDDYYTIREYGLCKWGGGVIGYEPGILRTIPKKAFTACSLSVKELRALGRYQNKEYGALTEAEEDLLDTVVDVFKREKQFEIKDLLQYKEA